MCDAAADEDEDEPEVRVQGAFDPETKTIYIAPDLMDDKDGQEDDDEE